MPLHAFNNLHVCWNFNLCLVSYLLGTPYKGYVGKRFGYYKRFLIKNIILINPCLMCDQLSVIYKCFAYTYMLYVSVRSETGHFCIHSFLLAKPLLMLIYSRYVYTKCASQRGWHLEWLWYLNLFQLGSICICFVNFLLVFDH